MKKNRVTRFHIIPAARGGKTTKDNLSFVPLEKHQCYHKLFGLRTPEEVIECLVDDFWKKQWHFVENAIKRRKQWQKKCVGDAKNVVAD